MQELQEHTLASFVTGTHKAAAVFEKYQLDFCCKGKRTLSQACEEKNIALEPVVEELQRVMNADSCAVQVYLPVENGTRFQLKSIPLQ